MKCNKQKSIETMNSKLFMVVAGITFLTACNVPGENEMKWFDRAVNTS